jgi:hypothetical protein
MINYKRLKPILNNLFILHVSLILIQCSSPHSPEKEVPEECLAASFHLKQGDYGFDVEARGAGSLQQVEIRLLGFPDSLSNILLDCEPVTGADAADLDGDGYPEVLIYAQSAGSGSYGNVLAYTYSPQQGFRPIRMPDLNEDSLLNDGYSGHDRFQLEGTRLLRRFPLYGPESANSEPIDSNRIVFYSFTQDELAPRFRIDGATVE